MYRRLKRLLKSAVLAVILLLIPVVISVFINIPWIIYIQEDEVIEIKGSMGNFSLSHQHNQTGLFIEPIIESNYYAANSINFTQAANISELADPNNNPNLNSNQSEFFYDYLFEKQNADGSYSDISGGGTTVSTYQVIDAIRVLSPTYLNDANKQKRKDLIVDFLWNVYAEFGFGFKMNQMINESDIISTFSAAYLANKLDAQYILYNDNISAFINSLWLGGFMYAPSIPIETAESTYYGIKALYEVGEVQKDLLRELFFRRLELGAFLISIYNNDDGGYKQSFFTEESDVVSTYYALSSLQTLGLPLINEVETFNYILDCLNPDGGFGLQPGENYTSEFKAGWAVANSLEILMNYGSLNDYNISEYISGYYNWSYNYQAKNGLFGEISIESNYLGSLSVFSAYPDEIESLLNISNIIDFANSCYSLKDGGYSRKPGENSSTYSTFCASNLYLMLGSYTNKWFYNETATSQFLIDLQNEDGGFKLGNDIENFAVLYGPIYQYYRELINPNISVIESTYWALSSLDILNSTDLVNMTTLIPWIESCQNADGGYSIIIGFHSDVVSTYYGLEILGLLDLVPMSRLSVIEFLKNAQLDDGSYAMIPTFSSMLGTPSTFIVSYMAAKALYQKNFQSEDIIGFLNYYSSCKSPTTGGMGDSPNFGADLHNIPYGILILNDLKQDRSFDPTSWNNLLFIIFIIELIGVGILIIYSLIQNLNLPRRIKDTVGYGKKYSISFLERFPAIRCENMSIYAGRKLIVDSMSMQLEHGEILGVLGESGAGKSTFVKGLLGMRKFKGISQIYGMNVKRKKKRMRPIYGYVPQDLSKIYLNFTVLENLIYFGGQYGISEKEIVKKSKRILKSLDIEDKTHEKVKSLSGGQKRRVSIAIGLIHNPIICILDEPSSGLDPVIRETLWLSLVRINEQFNTTLVVITHYPEESRFCHKVVLFGRGRGMIDFGRPRDLLSQLPGNGRTIELVFLNVQEDVIQRLEANNYVSRVLENKAGTDYRVFTDMDLQTIIDVVRKEFGSNSIKSIKQVEAKMEEFFRIQSLKIED